MGNYLKGVQGAREEDSSSDPEPEYDYDDHDYDEYFAYPELEVAVSKERIPSDDIFVQVDDGTIFYFCTGKYSRDMEASRLYVIHDGMRVNARLPGNITNLNAHGNKLYLESNNKIYSANFSNGEINIAFIRDKYNSEEVMTNGWSDCTYSGEQNGNAYVYRMHNINNGIFVDIPLSEIRRGLRRGNLHFRGIHRGLAIYIKRGKSRRTVKLLRKTKRAIILEFYHHYALRSSFSCRDSSPFLYVMDDRHLYTFDTRTLTFAATVCIGGYADEILKISVLNGILTFQFEYEDDWDTQLGRATLPVENYDPQFNATSDHLPNNQANGNTIDEFESEFANKFEPSRILGQGSFGCVFEARNTMDDWKYAVKRIPLRGSADTVNSALQEVRTLASLKHEGIVGYNSSWMEKPPKGWQNKSDAELLKKLGLRNQFNYRDDCVFIYIQMELCKQTLQQWLHTNRTRDLNKAKLWFKQLVSAVQYLHQKNKIHRDLKPSNILFDEDGRLKICDLGLVTNRSMIDDSEVDVRRTSGAGTPMYMAPEQEQSNYTSKVDIFSLGLILTELCVYMDDTRTYQVFTSYRLGRPNNVLARLPQAARLVALLTKPDPVNRPKCEEILNHNFLK